MWPAISNLFRWKLRKTKPDSKDDPDKNEELVFAQVPSL